uniref:F-box domain-containing protein n=1 Tax=Parascaris univalens TaxID=6257 RepID=A0A915A9U4_PARUN
MTSAECGVSDSSCLLGLPSEVWTRIVGSLPSRDVLNLDAACPQLVDRAYWSNFKKLDLASYLHCEYGVDRPERFDKAASYVIRRVGRHVRELALRRFLVNEYGMGNGLENALLEYIGENLRSLSIEYRLLEWPWLAKFVSQIGGKLRMLSLSCIFLRYCDSLTSDKVIRLLKSCRNLHIFHLRFHQEVNLAEISDAIPASLTCLKINGCPIVGRDILCVLRRCPSLNALSFTCMYPMHSRLGSFPNLRALEIDGAIGATQPIHPDFLGSFPNISRLEIASALASRELICSLSALSSLEDISLSGAHPYVTDPEQVAHCVEALSTLPSLMRLNVERNSILAHELIARIRDFHALEKLNLSFTPVTRDLATLSLPGFRSSTIRSLFLRSFSDCGMQTKTTQDLRHLTAQRFPFLEDLHI